MRLLLLSAFLLGSSFPVSSSAAREVEIVLWNAETMFDVPTVTARTDDLRAFARHFSDVDLVMLNEVTSLKVVNEIRDRMGLIRFYTACSNFAPDDFDTYNSFEVGFISRFPLANLIEYDPTPDFANGPHELTERPLANEHLAKVASLEEFKTLRGFLTADVPALGITVALTHLKSSRGSTGEEDQNNALLREFVATSMARFAVRRIEHEPGATVLIAGDMNVGETDLAKVGFRIEDDFFQRSTGDLYDDTHAIFSAGLVDGLHMASLTKGLGTETYDDTRFQGAGPIDCLYVVGRQTGRFALATRSPRTFGSDHFPVSTRFSYDGQVPSSEASSSSPGDRRVVPEPIPGVRISALLPNPTGLDAGNEWVKLKNSGDQPISLAAWRLRDKAGNAIQLRREIAPGEELTIRLGKDQLPLNNSGDTIELLDADNKPVHRIRYSGTQVSPGSEIRFAQ